jgi:hypothetical protein
MKRSLVTLLCTGILMILACNFGEGPVGPVAKPGDSENEIFLLSPHLEYIPCGRETFVAWATSAPLHNPKVDVQVEYMNAGKCIYERTLVNGREGVTCCPWKVDGPACSEVRLTITLRDRGRTFEESFDLGPARMPLAHDTLDPWEIP